MRRDKVLTAADALEELSVITKQMVLDLRADANAENPQGRAYAHTRVYWLRRELSRVIATLGASVPAHARLKQIDEEYQKQFTHNYPF
jgi:predicted ATPase